MDILGGQRWILGGGKKPGGGWTGDLISESSFIVAREQSITVNEKARIDLQMKISIDNRPAPMGVVINLLDDSTFYGIANPQFECSFWTDFGDSGATFDNISSELNRNDANKSPGWITGHVYAPTGTFTAVSMCKHHASGALGFAVHTFTSLDADAFYPGGKTICYDPDGVFSGAPSGATQVTTWAAARTAVVNSGANSRLMLARGKVFNISNVSDTGYDGVMRILAGCQYCAFGTGANPKIVPNAVPFAFGRFFNGEYWRAPTDGAIIFDIDFETDYSPITGVGSNYNMAPIFGPSMSGITVWHVNSKGFATTVYPYDDSNNGTVAQNNLIYDCKFEDWQDLPIFGHFHNGVVRGCNIRQNENATSGPGEKISYFGFIDGDDSTLTHTLINLAIFGDVANLALFDYSPTDYTNRAIDRSLSMKELILDTDFTFTAGTDSTQSGNTPLGDGTHQITLTTAIATGRQLYYHLRYWPRHGPIRLEKADGVGIIQNELRSKNGWPLQGEANQPCVRWNTYGGESVGGYIGYNKMEGGTDTISAGPQNDWTPQAVTGPLVIDQNLLYGDSATSNSIGLGLSNVLARNNVAIKDNTAPDLYAYQAFIQAGKNTSTTTDVDVNPIIAVNNTVINLTSTANGALNTVVIKETGTPFPLVSDINNLLYHEDRPTPLPVNYAPLDAANYYRPKEGSPAIGAGTQSDYVWDDFSGVLIDGTYSVGAFATTGEPLVLTMGSGDSLVLDIPELDSGDGRGEVVSAGQGYSYEFRTNVTTFANGFGQFGEGNIQFLNNFDTYRLRFGGPIYDIDISAANINDGEWHKVSFDMVSASGAVGITIDDVFYDSGLTLSVYLPLAMNTFTGDTDGTFEIRNIEYYTVGTPDTQLAFYAVDDGLFGGDTADATIGTGSITYNVDEGDWS